MKDKKLSIFINQVENGFIIFEDFSYATNQNVPRWVARSIEELGELVVELANQAMDQGQLHIEGMIDK